MAGSTTRCIICKQWCRAAPESCGRFCRTCWTEATNRARAQALRCLRGNPVWGLEPEDVEQEAVLGLLRAAETWKEGGGAAPKTWIYHQVLGAIRHCIRTARNQLGHKAWQQEQGMGRILEVRRSDMSEEQERALERRTPGVTDNVVERLALDETLDRLDKQLSPAQRRVFREVRAEPDVTQAEIARRIGRSTNTVHSQVNGAIARRLRAALAQQ